MEEKLSFEQIVLSPSELKLLQYLSKKFLPDYRGNSDVEALVRHGLAIKTMCAASGHEHLFALVITDLGKSYHAYIKKTRKSERVESVRFFWTTLIAILALLIAIAALAIDLWQLGLLQWQQG